MLATALTIAYGIDTIGLIYAAVAGVMALAQSAMPAPLKPTSSLPPAFGRHSALSQRRPKPTRKQ